MALISRTIFASDWLNLTTTTAAENSMIDRFIDSVEAEIEGICNQPIDLTTVYREFEGTGEASLRLNYTVPVTLVTLSDRDDPTDTLATVTGAVVFAPSGVQKLYLENRFTSALYAMTLSVGYTTAPQDVQTCAYEMCKELWYETPFAAQGERFGVGAINEADSGVSFAKTIVRMRSWVEPRLAPYKVYTV
jgi:hypothetical protein